ncbi:MAG: stage V sporulation protein AD, partial [Oscillibacter sp.]|nr:stage V sporulation protein AD [Oscillibacter sp.]
MMKRLGRRTVALERPPHIVACANLGGRQEKEGPLAAFFDELCDDSFLGQKTWEAAESEMQKRVLRRALERANLDSRDLDFLLAGDLLNQCVGSSFAARDFSVPFLGLYGACSTMGEALALAALLIDGGF